ncbi:MAG: NnrS family protein [Methylotenera sp.]|nr:NnrS family protein [Methylotenera sp.]
MQIPIKQTNQLDVKKFALFNLGFRPFFLGASFFAMISIATWMLVYFSYVSIAIENISVSQWHAHEMLYGYSMAVVAGFLLTAVKNWTGIPTLFGRPLMLLFLLWCVARLLFLFGSSFLLWVAVTDLLFGLMLIIAITLPTVKAKQWKQLAVVSKVTLLWIGNIAFYLGSFGILTNGMQYAIIGAVLLFIGLILMIGRRVIPFFIERGNETKVQLKQYQWLDLSILTLFVALFLNAIFINNAFLTTLFAWSLFALNGYRLTNWHISSIWRVPLLWSLYVSAWLINIGFLFYGLPSQHGSLSILTLHLFTIGGIGLMTLSMMSRVALGHTGRDIKKPSYWIALAFATLIASALLRAIVPMFTSQVYSFWVIAASFLWIFSFAIFVLIYTPILLKPRTDGVFG